MLGTISIRNTRFPIRLRSVELECVVRVGVHFHAALRRLHISAHHMQAFAHDAPGQSVTRYRHRRQYAPSIARRIVGFECTKRIHPLTVLTFAARDVDASIVDAGRHCAPRRRHSRACTSPGVGDGVIFLDDVDVAAAGGDERGADASADHVDLSVHRTGGRVIARRRHRRSRSPRVGGRIVFFDRSHRHVGARGMYGGFLGAGRRGRAADDVDLLAHRCRNRRAALRWHRRERLPTVGDRIVFPRVIHRHPRRRTGCGEDEAAECVDLAAVFGERNVVRQQWHRFLLCPLVGCRIVFVDHSDRLPPRREAAKHVHLSVCCRAEQLFSGLGKRRELGPFALRVSGRRQHNPDRQTREHHANRTIHDFSFAKRLIFSRRAALPPSIMARWSRVRPRTLPIKPSGSSSPMSYG